MYGKQYLTPPPPLQRRIAWIDYAKSMSIIGVMLCHSSSKVFQSVVFVDEIIKLFFLSLFFVCSGYVSGKLINRTEITGKIISWKDFELLIPFFSIGSLYCSLPELSRDTFSIINTMDRLLLDPNNFGYWFFLCLFLFRLAVIASQYTICLVGKSVKNMSEEAKFWVVIIFSTPIACVLSYMLGNIYNFVFYYIFYLGGFVMKRYSWVEWVMVHRIVAFTIALGAILLFIGIHIIESDFRCIILVRSFLYEFPLKVLVTFSVLWICVNIQGEYRWLLSIGQRSLDIYCLHGFFYVGATTFIPKDAITNYPWALQFVIIAVIAFGLVVGSLLLSCIIRKIPYLSLVTFGR